MSVPYTLQTTYTIMRRDKTGGDVTAADTLLDGSTAGRTFDATDVRAGAYPLNREDEQVTMIFPCYDASADKSFEMKIWGYAAGDSPAEFICDLSLTAGTARIGDVTTQLYVDTLTCSSQAHISSVNAVDNTGNNRVSKLNISTFGYTKLYAEVVDITAGMSVRPLIRSF